MSNIHLLYAGGTFGCHGTPLSPLAATEFLPALNPLVNEHRLHALPNAIVKDSSHLTPSDFVQFYRTIWQAHQDGATQFLVITGTDTLSYLTAFLHYALADLPLSLVITGSMLPLFLAEASPLSINTNSDALTNLHHALAWLDSNEFGVVASFGGQILNAQSIQKLDSEAIDAFAGTPFVAKKDILNPSIFYPNFELMDYHLVKYSQIYTLYLVPNQPELLARQLASLIHEPPTAIIILAFGAGNLPQSPSIQTAIKQLTQADFMVVIASSSPFGSRSQNYAAGSWQYQEGALPSKALPVPAVYAKLLWLCLTLPPPQRRTAWLDFIQS